MGNLAQVFWGLTGRLSASRSSRAWTLPNISLDLSASPSGWRVFSKYFEISVIYGYLFSIVMTSCDLTPLSLQHFPFHCWWHFLFKILLNPAWQLTSCYPPFLGCLLCFKWSVFIVKGASLQTACGWVLLLYPISSSQSFNRYILTIGI